MSLLFTPITLNSPRGPLTLPNRIVVAPMCQYACHLDGKANDWHLMHWANLLNSGAGVFMIEATAVTAQGQQCVPRLRPKPHRVTALPRAKRNDYRVVLQRLRHGQQAAGLNQG